MAINIEMLDIYDGQGRALGISKERSLVHRDGDWHRTFHCWIVYLNEYLNPHILLQKRSATKSAWPNRVDVTAAGHYLAGETILDGLRELQEELGVMVTFEDLISVGIRVYVDELQQGAINHEFQDVYFLIDNRGLSEYKLQATEVSGLISVSVDKALQLFAGEIQVVDAQGLQVALDNPDTLEVNVLTLTTDDFIPMLDNYYYRIMVLAKRLLSGERFLVI